MAQKALTSKGSQCSDCEAILSREDRFCPQCAAALTETFQAVSCGSCGSLAEASRIRCPACRAELRQVEIDDVEEEDLRLIPSLPLAAQAGLVSMAAASEISTGNEPLRDMRLSLQAAAALCYSAVQATLREELLWRSTAATRGRQEELKRALRTAGDTLHDVRKLLSSPEGMQSVLDEVRRTEISRLRDREAKLMRENEELRRALATREVLMLISEDDLIARLGDDLGGPSAAHSGMLEVRALQRVLDAVGALLSRLPPAIVHGLEGTPEHGVYERLVRLYATAAQGRGPDVDPHSRSAAGRRDGEPAELPALGATASAPYRRQPA